MKLYYLQFLIAAAFLSGCIYTVEGACKRDADSFAEGFECARKSYSISYAEDPTIKDPDWICGQKLSQLTRDGTLTDQQAWYLFWNARNHAKDNPEKFICLDWERLERVEKAVKKHNQEKQGIPND